jgi:Iap family predicted aminopeptidase
MTQAIVTGPRHWGSRAAVLTTILLLATASHADVPAPYAAAVAQAERDGRALYEAERSGARVDDAMRAVAKSRIHDFCDLDYMAIPATTDGATSVYFLGRDMRNSGVVVTSGA